MSATYGDGAYGGGTYADLTPVVPDIRAIPRGPFTAASARLASNPALTGAIPRTNFD